MNANNEQDPLAALAAKVRSKDLVVGIVGLGYVGLPLAVRFAAVGFKTIGVELDPRKIARLNAGESYIDDVAQAEVAAPVKAGRFRATSDASVLKQCDAISVCVPTPLSKFREPDLSAVLSVTEQLRKNLRRGQLIALESTTYPGTTEEVVQPQLEAGGMRAGTDYFLAFSPERIDPGRKDFTLKTTPKVVGGVTPACTEAARLVYGAAVDRVIPVSNARSAEMVKMLENTFRSVNIGLVNEMALMCDRLKIPIFEVIRAAATKPFGFMPFWPGPGLGGHCLPIDPLYLSWKMRSLDYRARFIELAEEVNRSMPVHVVNLVFTALNQRKKTLKGARVLVIGVAYKKDIDDVRESPAIDVIQHLRRHGADIRYHDPRVPHLADHGEDMESVPLDDATLAATDCAVIVTDHSGIDWRRIVERVALVVDARNATEGSRDRGDVVTL